MATLSNLPGESGIEGIVFLRLEVAWSDTAWQQQQQQQALILQ